MLRLTFSTTPAFASLQESARALACVGSLLLLPLTLPAQDPQAAANTARARAALAPVAKMVGRWEGDARVSMGPGEPMLVRQDEDIVWGAAGTVIIIRGTGRDPKNDAIVFEAAGTLWFDLETQRAQFRTHRDGRSVAADVEIRPDTMVWGFAVPGGRVRYVIALTDQTWHETGEFIRDGAPPVRTIEMRLRRIAK